MPRVAITNRQLYLDRAFPGAVFAEMFDTPAPIRGRGGDVDAKVWGTGRITPDGIQKPFVNHIRHATMPANVRATFTGGTSVYPPDDSLVADGTGTNPGTLTVGQVIQNYGNHSYRIRQPFDFNGRTGKFVCAVDAKAQGALASYIELTLSKNPVPVPGYHHLDNEETGPLDSDALVLSFNHSVGSGTGVNIGFATVYSAYAKTELTATFEATDGNSPTTQQDKLNYIEVRVSTSRVQIFMSDYSTDNGATFPNVRLIYDAPITLSFTRGYWHCSMRNHASVKFTFDTTHVYHWTKVGFDGPDIAAPRAYEVPSNTTTGTSADSSELDYPYAYMNLGYEVSDGSGRAEGVWSPTANISPLTFSRPIDLTGMTTAQLTFNWFVLTIANTPDTTWGIKYKFNGGTWRTRNLTSAEATVMINDTGTDGFLCMLVDITFADLVSGVNTIDFSTVNVPMSYAPVIQNIDLLLYA